MKFFRYIVPLLIVIAALLGFSALMAMKKDPPKEESHKHEQAVEVITAQKTSEPITLSTQGIIEAKRLTTLSAEVSGRVVQVSPHFQSGATFNEGEVLLQLDTADYTAALTQAEASTADARLALANEQAKADQAARDWQKLGGTQPPTDLVLRKPHLQSAQARLKAAEAALIKAHKDLDRTQVKAPYTGRLRAKHTELGAILTPGTRIAEIYSAGQYEIRLPLSLDDYAFLAPTSSQQPAATPITLHTSYGTSQQQWQATLHRVEGEVDRSSRTIFVVAELQSSDTALRPGLFVHASIQGRTLQDIYRIPRRAFLDETHILIADTTSKLYLRQVKPLRSAGTDMLVTAGIKEGEKVVLTALSAPVDGMAVKILSGSKGTPEHK